MQAMAKSESRSSGCLGVLVLLVLVCALCVGGCFLVGGAGCVLVEETMKAAGEDQRPGFEAGSGDRCGE